MYLISLADVRARGASKVLFHEIASRPLPALRARNLETAGICNYIRGAGGNVHHLDVDEPFPEHRVNHTKRSLIGPTEGG